MAKILIADDDPRLLKMLARTLKVESPFDYAANSRVIVVTDVAKDDPRQTAAAALYLLRRD